MDRASVINYLNTKKLSTQLAVEMIVDFAKSLNKNQNEIDKLVKLITESPDLLIIGVRNSKDYFKRKYEINSVSYPNGVEFYFY